MLFSILLFVRLLTKRLQKRLNLYAVCYPFYEQNRFSKNDFLKLWPCLETQVKAAREVSLIF